MALDLQTYLGPIAVGGEAYQITGNMTAGAQVAGYAAWIQSVVGSLPDVVRIEGEDRARVILTETQIAAMQEWLDRQAMKAFAAPGEAPLVQYELGPVFQPWAIKRAVPLVVGLFLLGLVGGYAIARVF